MARGIYQLGHAFAHVRPAPIAIEVDAKRIHEFHDPVSLTQPLRNLDALVTGHRASPTCVRS
ncbi:MAG: hypothetical protein SPE32_05245, partial [Mitsuokella sp.]|nr:hypothetical protein [Mitsuokella sp.]